MNLYIVLFLLVGACFGVASFSNRHLFSEGPTKADTANSGPQLGSRFFWLLVCVWLWPLLLLTGLNSAWIIAKRKRRTPNIA